MRPDPLISDVVTFSRRIIAPGSRVLVAVSGGRDSVALLCVLHRSARLLALAGLGVGHVNHSLRGAESDGDEQFVARLAGELGLPMHVGRLAGKTLQDPGLEAWAREGRYSCLHAIGKEGGYNIIATGHTADDQAQTVLMRLARGSGMRGLRGICASREDGVVRPLLAVSRERLTDWLVANGVGWREDSSNNSETYLRNRVRRLLLEPMTRFGPAAICNLADFALRTQDQWRLLQPLIRAWIEASVVRGKDDSVRIRRDALKGDETLASEGLAEFFRESPEGFTRFHIASILELAWEGRGPFLLPGRRRVQLVGEWVVVGPSNPSAGGNPP